MAVAVISNEGPAGRLNVLGRRSPKSARAERLKVEIIDERP